MGIEWVYDWYEQGRFVLKYVWGGVFAASLIIIYILLNRKNKRK